MTHPIPPVFDENSKILILGSFPSVKSREEMFFYGHPQNRFWRVLASVFDSKLPQTVEEKKIFLLSNRIALWDVLASCDVTGSADSSIKNTVPNHIKIITDTSPIRRIFLNGKTAEKYYNKYLKSYLLIDAVCLPSTSPANAAKSLDTLCKAWSVLKEAVTGDA